MIAEQHSAWLKSAPDINGWHVRKIRPGVIQRVWVGKVPKKSSYVKKGYWSKLTPDQVLAIFALKPSERNRHAHAIALAQLLNISPTCICNIWSGKTWR